MYAYFSLHLIHEDTQFVKKNKTLSKNIELDMQKDSQRTIALGQVSPWKEKKEDACGNAQTMICLKLESPNGGGKAQDRDRDTWIGSDREGPKSSLDFRAS